MTRIVIISDTHNQHWKLNIPEGDILIHCGDMTMGGTRQEIADFNNWIEDLPHKMKICIAGNHDGLFQESPHFAESLLTNTKYLENSGVIAKGLHFWGSPYTPEFNNWFFMKERGDEISKIWEQIPEWTDILITHGAPYGTLDPDFRKQPVGCYDLKRYIKKLKIPVHLFGHLHEGHGQHEEENTKFFNCSVLDDNYSLTYEPTVLDVEKKKGKINVTRVN